MTPFRTGNATISHVLMGYTFANAESPNLTGSMVNNGAVSSSLNCDENYTIPEGYHDGTGVISANPLSEQTIATATSNVLIAGYTAWVNGVKITGTRPAPAVRLTGTVTMPSKLESGDNYSGNVTFNPTFDIVPNVTYTKSVNSVNYASEMSVTISNITRTGFSFKIAPNLSEYHSYLGISSFTWVAQI